MDLPLIGGGDEAVEGMPRVDVGRIVDQLAEIRSHFSRLVADDKAGLGLETVEVTFGITAGGEVGFIAKGSVEVQGSITLLFSRPDST
ncbi:MAG TPA: CU044_2847 family protein [Acidimicrobiia bacterium]|jgi:hypothetical protein